MINAANKRQGVVTAAVLAAGLAAAPAFAQNNITPYGIVDVAVARTTNADAAGHSMTKEPSLTGSVPSRIGFRGEEDLGGGLSALVTLESGYNPDVGTLGQGGRIFGRQAWVGLKGQWGTLQLGRVLNMTYYALLKSDVLGPNLFSISSIDLYIPNARSDNAVAYIGKFGAVVAGATYSLGRDASAAGGPAATNCAGEVPGNAKACRQYTGLLGYEGQAYGINASVDKLYGNAGAANGLTSSGRFDRRITVNGYAMLGRTKIGAGVMDRKIDAATGVTESDLYYLGVSYPVTGQLTLDAQVARKSVKDSPDDSNLFVARLTYALSKRSSVYGAIGRMDNRGRAANALDAAGTVGIGQAQNGVMTGLRHIF
ncbi:MAG: porin [Massilia sp.]